MVVKRSYAIALACLVAIAILSAMWIAGRGHEVADPNAFRSRPTVTPFPTLDQRPFRVDVERRTIARLSTAEIGESLSHVQPLADDAVLVSNDKTGAWEIREQSGAHLVTLDVPLFSPLVSPGGRHLAQISDGAVVVYDWPERTSRTLGLDVGADAGLVWSTRGNRLAVLWQEGAASSRLLVVQAADGVVLTEQTWAEGEDVYLEGWTTTDALRVRVWEDGGCNPTAPNPCLPATSTLLELGESNLVTIEGESGDVSYYCGFEAGPSRCIPFEENVSDTTPNEAAPANAISEAPSPNGLYVAIVARGYLRLVKTSDQTFTDIPLPLNDVSPAQMVSGLPLRVSVSLMEHRECNRAVVDGTRLRLPGPHAVDHHHSGFSCSSSHCSHSQRSFCWWMERRWLISPAW